jgi:hypothetical protein
MVVAERIWLDGMSRLEVFLAADNQLAAKYFARQRAKPLGVGLGRIGEWNGFRANPFQRQFALCFLALTLDLRLAAGTEKRYSFASS